jgi:hypothetical protein
MNTLTESTQLIYLLLTILISKGIEDLLSKLKDVLEIAELNMEKISYQT